MFNFSNYWTSLVLMFSWCQTPLLAAVSRFLGSRFRTIYLCHPHDWFTTLWGDAFSQHLVSHTYIHAPDKCVLLSFNWHNCLPNTPSFVTECLLVWVLHCSDYLHSFGFDLVTTGIYLASADVTNPNICCQVTTYSASICDNPSGLLLFSWNTNILILSHVLMMSKLSSKFSEAANCLRFNTILFFTFHHLASWDCISSD
jgi:hypothetical protein